MKKQRSLSALSLSGDRYQALGHLLCRVAVSNMRDAEKLESAQCRALRCLGAGARGERGRDPGLFGREESERRGDPLSAHSYLTGGQDGARLFPEVPRSRTGGDGHELQ